MLTEEQKKQRQSGLGGTDIAVILGLSPYKTEHELYLEKTGAIEPVNLNNNEKVRFGNLLEEPIAMRYSEVTGREVYTIDTVVHPDYPYLLANPDRLIKGEKRGLEIKNVGVQSAHLWGESGSHQIPERHYPQIMHYLFMMDYEVWDIAALIGGNELRIYSFERDRDWDDIIIDIGTKFWKNHVELGVPPAPDWHHRTGKELIKRLYPLVNDEEVTLDSSIAGWRDVWLESKEAVKKYQQVVEASQAHIMAAMGNAALGRMPDGSCFTRKLIKVKPYSVEANSYIDFRLKKKQETVNE